jgi:3-methyladenine DNA glycosylase AlkD
MVGQFERGDDATKRAIYRSYLAHTDRINNWDLVDVSAPHIVGPSANRSTLNRLAKSKSLWERRIAILATIHFMRQGDVAETFRIAEMLVHDKHDLIHKAVGWMLREAGKRDLSALDVFLDRHEATMPRTMYRYATELHRRAAVPAAAVERRARRPR